jgi:NAD(P)-dependent dehydrogenase (short-subunit alcohol dehydrogenase family)
VTDVFDLTGKVAIVTGGAHGIGRAVAEVFAEAGARVFILDIDEKEGARAAAEIRERGHACGFLRADVSSAEDVRSAVHEAAEAGKTAEPLEAEDAEGRIDILCNNAAYLGPFHDLLNATPAEWQRCVEVSLSGTVNVTREVLPYMVRQQGGSIINVSSVQGMVGARDSVAYTTIKTGLVGFTRSVAYDYGKHSIRSNAICPGAITTRISPKPDEPLYERQVSKTMLGRVGKPQEVAYAALFLAADESAYVTGAVLPVDGGWTAM